MNLAIEIQFQILLKYYTVFIPLYPLLRSSCNNADEISYNFYIDSDYFGDEYGFGV